jgi:hypothetical protein
MIMFMIMIMFWFVIGIVFVFVYVDDTSCPLLSALREGIVDKTTVSLCLYL